MQALLEEANTRGATVKALTYCDMFRLDKADFDTIMEDDPVLKYLPA